MRNGKKKVLLVEDDPFLSDIYLTCLEKSGIEIWPSAWREKFLSNDKKMAFVTDPDGYEVEILER